jgi:hypothetical protein
MGSKKKFWFREPEQNQNWLFKYNRINTGEDWSEKIAAEIAELLAVPHAQVELARCNDERGIISKDFTDNGNKGLVHGNELLAMFIPDYPKRQKYNLSKHSISNILNALTKSYIVAPSGLPPEVNSPKELFLGYLLLDALIGNTDRHHENWGILVLSENAELAPTFDHASSLGRELLDERRKLLLSNPLHFDRYCKKAASAIYLTDEAIKPLSTIDAFNEFAKECSTKNFWLDKLGKISDDALKDSVEKVPAVIISSEARKFVEELLTTNKQRLLMLT